MSIHQLRAEFQERRKPLVALNGKKSNTHESIIQFLASIGIENPSKKIIKETQHLISKKIPMTDVIQHIKSMHATDITPDNLKLDITFEQWMSK